MLELDELAEIACEDRTGWSGAARSARLLELLDAQERVGAEVLRCAGEWDAVGAWAEDGALGAASWLSHRVRMATQQACELVRSARLVHGNTSTAKALAVGEVSTAHVHAAARAARHVEDLYSDHEVGILDAARITHPDDFKGLMGHWRSLVENLVGKEPSAARHARRHLHISEVVSMARIDGWVDVDTGRMFAAALDSLEPPDPSDGPEPPRSLSQRRADALARFAAGEERPRAQVCAVIDVDGLQGRVPADLTDMRCELLGGEPIDHSTALRLACDAAVSRVLMKGKTTVLDLGRATPVVSAALRRALEIRDRGCVEPGCNMPAEWCDAHHIIHWARGGRTDLDNLELRCRRHHIKKHAEQRGPPTRC